MQRAAVGAFRRADIDQLPILAAQLLFILFFKAEPANDGIRCIEAVQLRAALVQCGEFRLKFLFAGGRHCADIADQMGEKRAIWVLPLHAVVAVINAHARNEQQLFRRRCGKLVAVKLLEHSHIVVFLLERLLNFLFRHAEQRGNLGDEKRLILNL